MNIASLASALGDTGLVMNEEEAHEGEGIRNGTSAMRAYQLLRFAECVQ